MSSTARGFTVKDITYHGRAEIGRLVVNPAKVLPATATGILFTVAGSVVVTGLWGVVTTILSATAVKPSLGVTGSPAAIAAAPAAAYNASAVGSVIAVPPAFGGALPAAITAQAGVSGSAMFVANNTNITITTDATNTGAITWMLTYVPLTSKSAGSVTAV
jgi:hypothetical protein